MHCSVCFARAVLTPVLLAHLRCDDTYGRLAAGFRGGIATVYRYIREAVDLLAAQAPTLKQAMTTVRKKAYVILDGTVLPIDRIAADRPYYSGKKKHHGMNVQVLAVMPISNFGSDRDSVMAVVISQAGCWCLCKAALARNRSRPQRSLSSSVASSPQQQCWASQRRSCGSSQRAMRPRADSACGSVGSGEFMGRSLRAEPTQLRGG